MESLPRLSGRYFAIFEQNFTVVTFFSTRHLCFHSKWQTIMEIKDVFNRKNVTTLKILSTGGSTILKVLVRGHKLWHVDVCVIWMYVVMGHACMFESFEGRFVCGIKVCLFRLNICTYVALRYACVIWTYVDMGHECMFESFEWRYVCGIKVWLCHLNICTYGACMHVWVIWKKVCMWH